MSTSSSYLWLYPNRPQRGIKPPPVFPKTFRNGTVSDKQRADSLPGATETGSSTDSTASNWDGFEPSDSSSTTTATMQSTMEARRAFLVSL
ncbi:unnamed protein product [Anisakis simplex]|uniref:Uncharacterized protein n=1 Tax=Anisakis simplex TaxID=6269 RepID=A0A0M3KGH3_ANISI|nr:unnamed protein product [Anisakis simplex]